MKVILRQYSAPRPDDMVMFKNAVAGAKVLTDLLSQETFADLCTITLDLEGDGFTPVMQLHTTKWTPRYSPANLQHVWDIDMEECFGADNADNSLLRQIVRDIETAMRAEEEARDRYPVRPEKRMEK